MRKRRKSDDVIQRIHYKKSLKKRYKCRYNNVYYKKDKYDRLHDSKVIKNSLHVYRILQERSMNLEKHTSDVVNMPNVFSLEKNFDKSMIFIKELSDSLAQLESSHLYLDCAKCKETEIGALFLLKTVLQEYLDDFRYAVLHKKTRLFYSPQRIEIIPSRDQRVHNLFVSCEIYSGETLNNGKLEYLQQKSSGWQRGSSNRRRINENKKGAAVFALRDIISEGLGVQGLELTPKGIGHFDGILNEILGNAEDHSGMYRGSWYCFANFEENTSTRTGKINVAILNFGRSIYESFIYNEANSKLNNEIYSRFLKIQKKSREITEENIFTLSALQEGVSSLLYEDYSRGNGFTNLIESFFAIGDFKSKEHSANPRILIYSGKTGVKCDATFSLYSTKNGHTLSLNKENKLDLPPDSGYIWSHETHFPGTLITVKVYLNREHLKKKQNEKSKN
ncbi:MAG: hypothetical protein N4A37_11595 [Prolixibacteraceae bacterium]|jgi:hypothetical protein|nr:hypothetical protein [Prolixibacteraceae bacterium]